MKVYIYILVMAITTYLIRMLPLVLNRKLITNRFIKSFLSYIPISCLTCLTIPAILYSANSIISGAVALSVGLIAAFCKRSMVTVAVLVSLSVFMCEMIIR